MDKWDLRFLQMATTIGNWSKDPSSRVGALIVDDRNRVVSMGFNGPPRGVPDDPEVDREEKLRRTIHAEENALLFARQSVEGCTLYVTHPPCGRCAAKLIQSGVTRIVHPRPSDEFIGRWFNEMSSACTMFQHAQVDVVIPEALQLWEGGNVRPLIPPSVDK